MSRNALIAVIVAAVVLIGLGAFAISTKSKNTSNTSSSYGTTPQSSTSGSEAKPTPSPTPPATESNAVTIANFAFSPADITVKKGTTVTWTNKDSTTHTVTESDGQKGPDNTGLESGKTYSFTYDTVGTFKYHCTIHPSMTGTVTVTE